MKIVPAEIPDFESVKRIVQTTIRSVYPRYYPSGAVDFFARHHSDESIAADIAGGKVYLLKAGGVDVGTVTVHQNEIVLDASLPAKRIYRKRGYVDWAYHTIQTENGDFLCYDVMRKTV